MMATTTAASTGEGAVLASSTTAPSGDALRDLTSLVPSEVVRERIRRGERAEAQLPVQRERERYLTEQKIQAQQANTERLAREAVKLEEQYGIGSKEARETRRAQTVAEPEFKPSKMELDDYRNLAGMLVGIGMLAGTSGKSGAMYALNSLNGMMKGFAEGRRDLFKNEQVKFEKQLKSIDATNRRVQRDFEDAMSLLQTDRQLGLAKMERLKAELGNSVAGIDLQLNNTAKVYADLKDQVRQSGESLKIALDLRKAEEDRAARAAEAEAGRKSREDIAQQNRASAEERAKAERQLRRDLAEIRAKGGDAKTNQQMFIAQRMVTALRGAASSMESVMKLPSGATAGILPNLTTKDGMFNYVRNYGARSLTPSDQKAIETLFTGLTRYLATIEANGSAVGLVGLSKQMEKLYPVAGDKVQDIALKLADIRRVSTEAIEAVIASGLFPKQMTNAAAEQVKRMEAAIPYTTNEVVEAITRGRQTMREGTTAKVAGGKVFANEAEATKAFNEGTLKKGDRVTIGGKPGTWE